MYLVANTGEYMNVYVSMNMSLSLYQCEKYICKLAQANK